MHPRRTCVNCGACQDVNARTRAAWFAMCSTAPSVERPSFRTRRDGTMRMERSARGRSTRDDSNRFRSIPTSIFRRSAATSSETRCGQTWSKEPRTGDGPGSGIAGIRAIAAGSPRGPLRRLPTGSIMSTSRRRRQRCRRCDNLCGKASLLAARHGNRPRPTSSGLTWPRDGRAVLGVLRLLTTAESPSFAPVPGFPVFSPWTVWTRGRHDTGVQQAPRRTPWAGSRYHASTGERS